MRARGVRQVHSVPEGRRRVDHTHGRRASHHAGLLLLWLVVMMLYLVLLCLCNQCHVLIILPVLLYCARFKQTLLSARSLSSSCLLLRDDSVAHLLRSIMSARTLFSAQRLQRLPCTQDAN